MFFRLCTNVFNLRGLKTIICVLRSFTRCYDERWISHEWHTFYYLHTFRKVNAFVYWGYNKDWKLKYFIFNVVGDLFRKLEFKRIFVRLLSDSSYDMRIRRNTVIFLYFYTVNITTILLVCFENSMVNMEKV